MNNSNTEVQQKTIAYTHKNEFCITTVTFLTWTFSDENGGLDLV